MPHQPPVFGTVVAKLQSFFVSRRDDPFAVIVVDTSARGLNFADDQGVFAGIAEVVYDPQFVTLHNRIIVPDRIFDLNRCGLVWG